MLLVLLVPLVLLQVGFPGRRCETKVKLVLLAGVRRARVIVRADYANDVQNTSFRVRTHAATRCTLNNMLLQRRQHRSHGQHQQQQYATATQRQQRQQQNEHNYVCIAHRASRNALVLMRSNVSRIAQCAPKRLLYF